MNLSVKQVQRRTAWSAADRKRHKAIRAKMQRDKLTPDELMASGTWMPLGAYLVLKDALARLKQDRKKQGVSLAELSRRTGIDKAALSRLENGRQTNPTFATLTRYAAALNKELRLKVCDANGR